MKLKQHDTKLTTFERMRLTCYWLMVIEALNVIQWVVGHFTSKLGSVPHPGITLSLTACIAVIWCFANAQVKQLKKQAGFAIPDDYPPKPEVSPPVGPLSP